MAQTSKSAIWLDLITDMTLSLQTHHRRLLNKDGMLRQLIIAVILAYTSSLVEGNWRPILSCIDFSLSFPFFKIILHYSRGVHCNTVFFVTYYKLGWLSCQRSSQRWVFSLLANELRSRSAILLAESKLACAQTKLNWSEFSYRLHAG